MVGTGQWCRSRSSQATPGIRAVGKAKEAHFFTKCIVPSLRKTRVSLCASAFRVWGSFRFASLQTRPFGLNCLMIILFNKSLATGNHSFHCTTRRTVNAEATARRNRCERIAARNVRGHCCRRPMTDGWSLPRKRGYNNAANKTPTTAARPVHFLHLTLSRATVQSSIYQWGFFFLHQLSSQEMKVAVARVG